VFCFICSRGHQAADADDLTQQFFLGLLEKDWNWLQRADPDRGRFRALLLKVLKDFLCDQGPRAHKQWHFERGQVSLSAAERGYQPTADVLPEVEFDRQWPCELTRKVLADLERSSHTLEERAGHQLLLARQYSERSAGHPSREQVAANHGLTVHKVRRAEETVRKRFVRLLRMEIREQVSSEEELDEVRQEIPGGYVLNGPYQVGFRPGPYDSARPLVIDPVLVSSTYFGGDGYHGEYFSPDKDAANDIAVDAKGNVYVTGATNSLGRWDADASVIKFDPTLSTVLYATFLDGSGWDDVGNGIAVDAAGNAYVTGSLGSISLGSKVFAAKLDATGSPLGGYFVYFGTLGGYGVDIGHDIAVDPAGNAYVTGETGLFAQFPTTPGAFQPAYGGGWSDAFVVKLNGQGAFVYSTYLGGSTSDEGYGIAVDADGNAYVTGATDGGPASAFPTTPQAFQPTSSGWVDAFVTKLNAQGSALVYSTCLGGIRMDEGHAIAVDAAGNAYVTGTTMTLDNNFPITPGAFQTTFGGGVGAGTFDAFVTKLNADGSALVYSSYLGGGGYSLGTEGYGIAVDAAGNAYVTGDTIDLPTVNPFQAQLAGKSDAFVTRVNPAGSALIYSSYLGGSRSDVGLGIAVNAAGNVYVAGTTSSLDFPTTPGAYQPNNGGGDGGFSDAFITQIVN
jgi:hypothetical protein